MIDKHEPIKSQTTAQNAEDSENSNLDFVETKLESTKENIQKDVDELSSRLNPSALKEQVQESLGDAQEAVISTVQQITDTVGSQAKNLSSSLADNLKTNPWASALMGLGVGFVVAGSVIASSKTEPANKTEVDKNQVAPSSSTSYGKARAFNSDDSETSSKFSEISTEVSHKSSRTLSRWMDEQPLLVGGISLVAGAAIGLLIPKTSYENEMLGESRNAVIDSARNKVHDAVEVAKKTVNQASSTVQEELKDHNISSEGLENSVKAIVEETKAVSQKAFDTAKETLKSEAKKRNLISSSDSEKRESSQGS